MSEAEIEIGVEDGVGRVLLNRPKALNALTLDQVRVLLPALERWAADPSIRAVIIEGAGDKAFCAGGDIRALVEARNRGDVAFLAAFYGEEYRLNRRIKTFPKPYVALIDGIVMGGGVGLSVHGGFRVAGERTMFAMPETGIGFFPDVGGGHFLPRCPGQIGMYLALTGARLKTADALYAGVATHFVPAARRPELVAALVAGEGDVGAVLERFHQDPGPAPLAAHRALIDRCFAADTYDGVLAALAAESDPFAAETLAVIATKSPTACRVSFALVRRGAGLDFDANMRMEFRLALGVAMGEDFAEGVRAVILDKDGKPAWRPAAADAEVAALFDAAPAMGDLTF